MMLLRYCGCPDSGSDFWFDVRSKHLHPVGWCYRARYRLVPPAGQEIFFLLLNCFGLCEFLNSLINTVKNLVNQCIFRFLKNVAIL